MSVLSSSKVKLGLVEIDHLRQLLIQDSDRKSQWIKDLADEEFAREFSRIAHTKRFTQRWQGDPQFREQFLTNPQETLDRYNLDINAEEIRFFWDEQFRENNQQAGDSLLVQRCRDFARISESSNLSTLVDASHNQRYKAWRQRQINRCSGQMVKSIHDQIGHFPVSFELSKGCSVGCWFCSVSAPRLGDIFFYTPENARLWRDTLAVLQEILGTAAADGFCYWATDPLDNPDYEKFLRDFRDILGTFPQTTTAQPLKDPARTKSLLKLALEKGCKVNRFSILSLKMLDRVHQEFTPEELAFVGLVQQQKEAGIPKANAGRMRERIAKQPSKKQQEVYDESIAGTNACVTGFLFSMVERTVKLISPCPASDRSPNGYRVYTEGTFNDAAELKTFLSKAIETYMPLTVRDSDLVAFREDLQYETIADGFQVFTPMLTFKFCNDSYLQQLGEVIRQGDRTVAEIVALFKVFGIPAGKVRQSLNLMFDKGVLNIS